MVVYIHLSSSHQSPAKTSKEPGAARGSNLSGVWEHGWLKSCHELQTGCQELQTYTSKIIYISMILYVHYNMDIPIVFFEFDIFEYIWHYPTLSSLIVPFMFDPPSRVWPLGDSLHRVFRNTSRACSGSRRSRWKPCSAGRASGCCASGARNLLAAIKMTCDHGLLNLRLFFFEMHVGELLMDLGADFFDQVHLDLK